MITCEYIGRMGNNLFQIAAAETLARRNNDSCHFSPWKYHDKFSGKISISHDVKKENYNLYREPSFSYNEIPYNQNTILYGYFQSEKYFDKDYIKDFFQPKETIREVIYENYANILQGETVGIHFRRTDYLQIQHQHPVQSMDYYNAAIEEIGDCDRYIVFSDDINWCKNNLSYKNMVFIEGNPDYIDLFLMSMCKHNIIANSTFSWWAAWLNKNQEKKIIATSKWFGDHYKHNDTKDLYPEEWKVI